MEEKIKKAKDVLVSVIGQGDRPCMAWSGGKDSMALLHLALSLGLRMPIVQYREPWQPWKYAFQNSIIEKFGLEVYTWHPFKSLFQQNGDEYEVQNHYRLNNTEITCPSGITPPEDGKPWVCAIDMAARPKQDHLSAPWNVMIIGHKACDSDPIYGGDAGTRIDVRVFPGCATMVFPLREWSHEDVWRYIEDNNVPYDKMRYEKGRDEQWRERADRSFNCDYVHACTACLDRREGAPKTVHCPKYDAQIENVSKMVEWADQTKPSYMRD